MGIKGFQNFLTHPRNTEKALEEVECHDQYILIDGSEIIYELFFDENFYSRANYVEFREKLESFFKNLKKCDIKPIVIKDGFKFEHNSEIYAKRREKKIERLKTISKKKPTTKFPLGQNKGYFCEPVFKQTAKELDVPFFFARHDTDEDLAALSRLLDAPVLASDTIFAAYHLPAGWLPLKEFEWKNILQKEDKMFIKGKLFKIDRFATNFRVQPSALSFLAILFENRNFDKYEAFRKHVSSKMGRRFDRPYNVSTFLDWCVRQYDWSNEEITEQVLQSVRETVKVDEERASIEKQLNDFDYPRMKRDLLQQLQGSIQDEGVLLKLETAAKDAKEEEDGREPIQRKELMEKTCDGDFPYWALQLLISSDWNKELIHFLAIVNSDPVNFKESPQAVGAFIREWSYRILLRNTDKQEVTVYIRKGEDYKKEIIFFYSYQDEKRLFSSVETDNAIELRRQDFILGLLIDNADLVDSYKRKLGNLSDDMKLTLAVTICWIRKALPSFEMQKAMAILFTFLHLKEKKNFSQKVKKVTNEFQRIVESVDHAVDTQVLQWTSQWEVLLEDARNLNLILKASFPIPMLGKFFSGSILENVVYMLSNHEQLLMEMLHKLDSFQTEFDEISTIMSGQEVH